MSLGCSTGFEKDTINHHAENVASLAQQGQFTEAMILSSLYDSSSFNMRGPELAAGKGPEDASALTDNTQALTVKKTEKHPVPQLSPLQVHLPPEHGQITDLDEKQHAEIGWSLLVGGNYEGAVAAYREALRQNGDFAEAYVGLGSALRMQNNVSAAIEAYEQALHLQPDYPAALVHLGSIYADGAAEHRDVEKAKQLYARASQQGDPFATMALQELNTRQ